MHLDNDTLRKLYVITEKQARNVTYAERCIRVNAVCREWELIPQPLAQEVGKATSVLTLPILTCIFQLHYGSSFFELT